MRVLFVDDEQLILNGLRRMLHSKRKGWETSYAISGEEGLKIMDERQIDVVVSDMVMPVMDGAEFLRRVMAKNPGACRIILSGHSEKAAALRAARVAHQFLSKPCNSDVVIHVIETTQALNTMLLTSELKELVADVESLPPAPQVYTRLTEILADPECGLDEIHCVIHGDIGVCSKMLQLVNSSFFGIAQGCFDLRQALMFLGTETLNALVLAAEVFKGHQNLGKSKTYSAAIEQAIAMRTFRIAEIVSRDIANQEHAPMAAMLHRIGKLVLASARPKEFDKTVAASNAKGGPAWQEETEQFGAHHGTVGAYLLGLWGLPIEVVHAVAHYELPRGAEVADKDLLGVLHVSAAFAQADLSAGIPASLDMDFIREWGYEPKLSEWITAAEADFESDSEAA